MSKVIKMHGGGLFGNTVSVLRHRIPEGGVSTNLVGDVYSTHGGTQICLLVFEKYFYRASNYVSLTIMVTGKDGDITVDIVSSGGGQNLFLKMSWWSEDSFVNEAKEVLLQNGFLEI